jgi:hypothetical protein
MPFEPGKSGNPGGRKRSLGLSRAVRRNEGLKTWAMLLAIRDGKVREQIIDQKTGEVYDVVPSVKEQREVCKMILAYCWGTPAQVGQDELDLRISELEQIVARRQR